MNLTEAEKAEAARLAAEMRERLIRELGPRFGPHAPLIVGAVYEHLSRAVRAMVGAGASYADAARVVAVCAREAAAVLESGAEVVVRRGRS